MKIGHMFCMNLFTRNSPYYHLLKHLLFLLKHPVYICSMNRSALLKLGENHGFHLNHKYRTVFILPHHQEDEQ